MSNLLLTLDDAVNVAVRYMHDYWDACQWTEDDTELLRQNLEQKCWIPGTSDDPRSDLCELIMDVNPAEIASQIERDNLRKWCETLQVEMQLALIRIPGQG